MPYQISDEMKAMKELARKFATERLAPMIKDDYEAGITRRDIVEEMGALGLIGCLFPECYGGTEAGYLCAVIMAEETGKVSASYAGRFMPQLAGPPGNALEVWDAGAKGQVYQDIILGKCIPFFAATEPDAGSDVAGMRATAVEKGGHYVLNRVKPRSLMRPSQIQD